jgi:hypothetical protein
MQLGRFGIKEIYPEPITRVMNWDRQLKTK